MTALSSELHPSFIAARVGLAYCWANLMVLAIALLFVLLGGSR